MEDIGNEGDRSESDNELKQKKLNLLQINTQSLRTSLIKHTNNKTSSSNGDDENTSDDNMQIRPRRKSIYENSAINSLSNSPSKLSKSLILNKDTPSSNRSRRLSVYEGSPLPSINNIRGENDSGSSRPPPINIIKKSNNNKKKTNNKEASAFDFIPGIFLVLFWLQIFVIVFDHYSIYHIPVFCRSYSIFLTIQLSIYVITTIFGRNIE